MNLGSSVSFLTVIVYFKDLRIEYLIECSSITVITAVFVIAIVTAFITITAAIITAIFVAVIVIAVIVILSLIFAFIIFLIIKSKSIYYLVIGTPWKN